jgi:hypothetical protein
MTKTSVLKKLQRPKSSHPFLWQTPEPADSQTPSHDHDALFQFKKHIVRIRSDIGLSKPTMCIPELPLLVVDSGLLD